MRNLVIFLLLTLSNALSGQEDASNAFDFWIGDWEVYWYGADSTLIKGSNKVEKILEDKVIQENFVDPSRNFLGRSLSVYNRLTKTWHQAWVDNQGGYYNFIGDTRDEQKIFITPEVNSQGILERMIFVDITKDTFTWKWQGKKPDAVKWTDQWIIYYQRKK